MVKKKSRKKEDLKKERQKPLVIALISLGAIIILGILVFFIQSQFAGKAFYAKEENTIGIAPITKEPIPAGESLPLTIMANLPKDTETIALSFQLKLPSGVSCKKVKSELPWDKADLNVKYKVTCPSSGIVSFESYTIDYTQAQKGEFPLATVTVSAKEAGKKLFEISSVKITNLADAEPIELEILPASKVEFTPSTKQLLKEEIKWGAETIKQVVSVLGLPSGDKIETSTDLANNFLFYNLLNSEKQSVYFKYKKQNYKVELLEEDPEKGVKLKVINLANSQVKAALELPITKDNPWHLVSDQIGVSLEGNDAPEIYLSGFGSYNEYQEPSILVVLSPKVNLDSFSSGKVFLLSEKPQKLSFAGEKDINLIVEGKDNLILLIEGEEYQYPKLSGTHFFDLDQKEGVYFNNQPIYEISSAIIDLSKVTSALESFYEDTFSQSKILDLDGKFVQVCKKDPLAIQTLAVCDKYQKELFDLFDKKAKVDSKISLSILFLYQSPKGDKPKTGAAFNLKDLSYSQTQQEKAFIFTSNLVQEKRLALRLEEKYYLLSHPKTAYLSLPLLNLTDVTESGFVTYPAEGNQEEVVFNLPLGRQINVKLNLVPEMSYSLSAKTSVKKEVNLNNELQAKVSTYGSVYIYNPDFWTVKVSSDDIKTFMNKMKVNYNNLLTELDFKKPKVVENTNGQKALFYYNQFTNAGANTFNKYADIYLYYDLTENPAVHEFSDNNFILPIAKGNKIAFGLEENYYLIGYSEPWDPLNPAGFDLNKLQVTSLDGSQKYPAQLAEDGGVVFDVAPRQIEITVDTDKKQITFSGVTAIQAAKTVFDPNKDYEIELPQSTPEQVNILEIGGQTFWNCDTLSTKGFKDLFLLCIDTKEAQNIYLDQPVEMTVGNNKILVWYKEKAGNKKKIIFQKIFDLPLTNLDWEKLVPNLAEDKNPVLRWNGRWFELNGGETLSEFYIKEIPLPEDYLISMSSEKDGYNNGTIAVKNDLFWFEQLMKANQIRLNIKPLPEKLVTEEGLKINSTKQLFASSVNIPIYEINLIPHQTLLAATIGSFGKPLPFYSAKLPEKISQEILLPNGEMVILTVANTTKPEVVLKKMPLLSDVLSDEESEESSVDEEETE